MNEEQSYQRLNAQHRGLLRTVLLLADQSKCWTFWLCSDFYLGWKVMELNK